MVLSKVKLISTEELVNVGLFSDKAQAETYNEANYTPAKNYEFTYFNNTTGEEIVEE